MDNILIKHEDIVGACKKIGTAITKQYEGKELTVICVLKGAEPFHAELIKHIDLDMQTDFVQVKSYEGTESTGVITLKKDIDTDISGKDIVIVEDIVDSGYTLTWLKETLSQRGPNSITVVTMLDKPSRRKIPFEPDYVCFTIDDLFVYGFGLDLDEKCRNLKDIYVK